ncbi:MAG: undecaprenyldiphospho-muramoylpentapeptide beta-N-acetylglucosaminyltransferase [Anaerolineae bacterium]|nr:undecaprenyldiphospho-muramoylpentapeptide beta-N-acetylglucosaminyltransferase [Anaerolineae bacterium]
MRAVLCGGGTGGHVYPILAVVEALRRQEGDGLNLVYTGMPGSVEARLAARADIPFETVESGQMRGRAPWDVARSLVRLARGIGQARRLLKGFRPHVVFTTGGYGAAPVLIAARLAAVPALIFLPDAEPGLTVKFLSRLVPKVAVTFPEVQAFFPPGKTVVTGYPVRPELLKVGKDEALRRLGLKGNRPILLAFGGSKGARSINRAVVQGAASLLEMADVVHITGSLDYPWVAEARAKMPAELQAHYLVFEYLEEEMGCALAAADLVVSRAGASTLGEFPAFGLPSVLVPYPYSGQHQYANARFLMERGAAVMMEDKDLPRELVPAARRLLADESRRLEMGRKAAALAQPGAAERIAAELRRLAAGGEG